MKLKIILFLSIILPLSLADKGVYPGNPYSLYHFKDRKPLISYEKRFREFVPSTYKEFKELEQKKDAKELDEDTDEWIRLMFLGYPRISEYGDIFRIGKRNDEDLQYRQFFRNRLWKPTKTQT